MTLKGFNNYPTSRDYHKLKELLDSGEYVIIVWRHDTTARLFSGVAERVSFPVPGGVDGCWYSLDCWNYFPTINKESFEDFCKSKNFLFILPSIA